MIKTHVCVLAVLACCACGDPRATAPAPHRSPPPERTRLVLLGTGTPIPEPYRTGPSAAVVCGDQAYLVDAGTGVVRRAQAACDAGVLALDPARLDIVFVTHLHSDHTIGLADLWTTAAVAGRSTPLSIYGPAGIGAMVHHLTAAYAIDTATRTRDVSAERAAGWQQEAHEVEPGLIYEDAVVRVNAFAVRHGEVEPSFGYRFDTADRSIVFSGDTAPSQAVVAACNGCDILVHEVYSEARWRHQGSPRWKAYHRSHHTSTVEVADIAARARPGLLVLTHVLHFGASNEEIVAEVRAHYDGAVVLGQDLGLY